MLLAVMSDSVKCFYDVNFLLFKLQQQLKKWEENLNVALFKSATFFLFKFII